MDYHMPARLAKSPRQNRADPATGKVDEYKIPFDGHAYPRRMGADSNGDLWVALWNAGKLMKVDHKTKQMSIFSPPKVKVMPQVTT